MCIDFGFELIDASLSGKSVLTIQQAQEHFRTKLLACYEQCKTHEQAKAQTARAGREVSTLQPSWLTDVTWLYGEKDPDLTAQTAGRCPTESEDELVCPGSSRLYCRECRTRTASAQPSAAVHLSVPSVFATKNFKLATATSADPIRCRFGHGGAGLRRLERWYALRCPLPLYYVGCLLSMTPSSLSGRNQPPARLGLSWAASTPAAQAPWGDGGGRKENEAELGPRGLYRVKSWGYSAFQYTPPDLAAKANRCAGRFAATASARSPPSLGAKSRNYR